MASKPLNLVLDWDGTITTKDTMFAYGKIASIRDVRLGKTPTGSESFEKFGKAWLDDYTAHEAAYTPKAEDRRQPGQESAWLRSISVVEESSAKRVEASGFFSGVVCSDVENAAKELLADGKFALRDGWKDLFVQASTNASKSNSGQGHNLNISILSVNWSETFIRASLSQAFKDSRLSNESDVGHLIEPLPVKANEISGLDNSNGSSGRLTDPNHPTIRTSFDKLQNLKTQAGAHNIYVGDSATDFDCLITADVGICMRDEPMGSSAKGLAETLSRVGYHVRHAGEIEDRQELLSSPGPNLLWVRDFHEILDLFSRLQGRD